MTDIDDDADDDDDDDDDDDGDSAECSGQADASWKEMVAKIASDKAKWLDWLRAKEADKRTRHHARAVHQRKMKEVGGAVVSRCMDDWFKFLQSKDAQFIAESCASFAVNVIKRTKVKEINVRRVCLVDFTKLGTMSKEALDWCIGLAEKITKAQPSTSCVIIVAPWLVSDAVEDGADGERKNIELKCKNRGLKTYPITLHGSRRLLGNVSKRPLFYCAWMAFPTGTESPKPAEMANIFLKCPLFVDRGNQEPFVMIPENDFLTPENGVAGLARGSAAEDESVNRVRGVGYSRNITGGESFAEVLLKCLTLPGDTSRNLIVLADITPCQGFLQGRTFLANTDETQVPNNPQWASFAVSFDGRCVELAKKTTKKVIFEAWRKGDSDDFLKVDPNKKERHVAEPPTMLDRATLPTLMALTGSAADNSLSMPEALLQRWAQDAVRGPKLRLLGEELLRDFPPQASGASLPSDRPAARPVDVHRSFPDEQVRTRGDIRDADVWAEYASNAAGVSIVIVKSESESDGSGVGKGYACCKALPAKLGTEAFLFCYHAGGWLRGRQGRARQAELDKPSSTMVACRWTKLDDPNQRIVIESRNGGGDTAPKTWSEAIISLCESDPQAQQNMTEISIDCHKCFSVGSDTESTVSVAVTTPEQYELRSQEDFIFNPDIISQDDTPITPQNTASYVPRVKLQSSPLLEMVWRVLYSPQNQQMRARKPLWYLRSPVEFSEVNQMVRLW